MHSPGHRHGKPTDGFRQLKLSLEPETMDLGIDTTPVTQFFVCSAGAAPLIDPDLWRLRIDGDAVTDTVELGLADLGSLDQHTETAWLECAGNGRRLYEFVDGHQPSGVDADTPWTLGAMAIGEWRGPRLGDVLDAAGLTSDAAWIAPTGADHDNTEGESIRMCMPLGKAVDPDTIVATQLNGEPLPDAHGNPARLIVPGWVGAYSVKWLERLEVSAQWIPSWRADVYYRLRSPDGTDLGPATTHPIKSSLALEWGAQLMAGPHRLTGYARSGEAPVERVEYSVDDGPWAAATLLPRRGRWGWQAFSLDWEAVPGDHQIRTRAWDDRGICQPDSVPYNPSTILWNAVTPHPVHVAG